MYKVLVKVSGYNQKRLLNKLYDYKITLYDIWHISENESHIKISYNDYKKMCKYLKYYELSIIKYYGVYQLKKMIIYNRLLFISILISLIFIFILSNVITSVEVIHSNNKLKDIIINELKDNNIKKYSFKKKYKEIESIKKNILNNYKSNIEWIEIVNSGMGYKVYFEERIINNIKEEKEYCNVIALKDGIITKIIASKGEIITKKNNNVIKGDLLISGDILNTKVCAKGVVYAEVWYKVNVNIPLDYEEKIVTNKKRYNITYKRGNETKKIFKSKYSIYEVKRKELFNIFDLKVFFDTEYKINTKKKKHSESSAIKKAIELSDQKFNTKFVDKERILTKNVLKKEVNNSTMEVEIFYAIEEIISKIE